MATTLFIGFRQLTFQKKSLIGPVRQCVTVHPLHLNGYISRQQIESLIEITLESHPIFNYIQTVFCMVKYSVLLVSANSIFENNGQR